MFPVNPAIAIPLAELLLQAALWMYQRMSAPQPLVDSADGDERYCDKKRYNQLRLLYTQCTDKDIPKEWVLDDAGCPTYASTFADNVQFLKAEIAKLDDSTYQQKEAVGGMVAHIEQLFAELHSKKATYLNWIVGKTSEAVLRYADYRPDGFEAMFFSELAIWLSISLPRESIHDEQTAILLARRIQYCEEVQKILIFRGDDKNANSPKIILGHITRDLRILHASVLKACHAASFNTKIQTVNATVRGMGKSVFDFLLLLLDESSADYNIQVAVILEQDKNKKDPTVTKEPHAQKILGCLTGQWIVATLQKAGIESNQFDNGRPIDPHFIQSFLSDDFSKIPMDKTGFSKFPQCQLKAENRSEKRKRIESYLRQIIEIHRSILMMYFVRESIVVGSEVSKDLGNAWVYGENTGKGIALVLCMVILDSCSRLHDQIIKFWDLFYKDNYINENRIPNAQKHDVDPYCKKLNKADTSVQKIKRDFARIKHQLEEIQREINSYAPKDMVNKIRLLKQNLSTYVRIYNLPLEENLKQEINYSEPLVHEVRFERQSRFICVDNELVKQDDLVIEYEQNKLPYYMKIRSILDKSIPVSCALMSEPDGLSQIQRMIYREFLLPNSTVANLGFWRYLSGLFSIYPTQIDDFIKTYSSIHSAMRILYLRTERAAAGLLAEPIPVEHTLIDQLLNERIREDFRVKQYYPFNALLPSPPLLITLSGTKIQLRFTGEWFDTIKDDLLLSYVQTLIDQLDEKERQIQELMRERQILENNVVEKEQEITRLNGIVETQRLEIVEKTSENAQLMKTIAEKEEQLPAISQQVEKSERDHRELRQRFSEALNVLGLFPTQKEFPKFIVTLITVPSGEIATSRLGEAPFLIQKDGEYHLYGRQSSGSWGLTQLNRETVQSCRLPFPSIEQEISLSYVSSDGRKNKELRPLYEHIFDTKAHIPDDSGVQQQRLGHK